MKKLFLGSIILLIVGTYFSSAQNVSAEDIVIIANRSVPVASLSTSDIKDIYLGNKKTWGNGVKISFVTLGKNDTSEEFLKKYLRMNPSTFKKYWEKKLYTGSGKPPYEFQRDKHLLQFVSETKGAVGYLSKTIPDDNVKILPIMN